MLASNNPVGPTLPGGVRDSRRLQSCHVQTEHLKVCGPSTPFNACTRAECTVQCCALADCVQVCGCDGNARAETGSRHASCPLTMPLRAQDNRAYKRTRTECHRTDAG
jgi:hypothetical protein